MIRLSRKKKTFFAAVIAASALPVNAAEFQLGGGEANVMGYISQGMSYGLRNAYDTQRGVNSLITTALIEGDYKPDNSLKFYGALMATGDLIYSARDNWNWSAREFDQSGKNLRFDNKNWQVLRELHMTYSGENSMLRIGKQVVKWGEMDGQQVIDTINPVDQRRGFADVEFETSVIPTWLIRGEYYPKNKPDWLQDLGLEYVFNPNVQFIPSQPGETGNDAGGVWGPSISPSPTGTYSQLATNAFGIPLPFPVGSYLPTVATSAIPPLPGVTFGPPLQSRVGSNAQFNLTKPSGSDGMEHAFRIKANIGEALATFNAFYGREKLPVSRDIPGTAPVLTVANDGSIIEHHRVEGYYPRKKFLGVTLATDLTSLKVASLGGVSPVLRLESLYSFDSTFSVGRPAMGAPAFTFDKRDIWRSGVGLDWKVKIDALNARNFIVISPQVFYDRIIKFPDDAIVVLGPGNVGFERNNYSASLMLSTAYMNDKLLPKLFVLRDFTNRAYWTRLELAYAPTNQLSYVVGAQFLGGSEPGKSMHVFNNKDHLFAKVTYKF